MTGFRSYVLGVSHFLIAFFLQKSAGAGRLFPDQIAVETLKCVDPKKFVEATAVWRKCYLEIMIRT